MLIDIDEFISNKWLKLIGRPRLTLINHKCGNISCGKDDYFKKIEENHYICQCGYEIIGNFEIIQYKVKLYCGISKCYLDKKKMDLQCIKCKFIKER